MASRTDPHYGSMEAGDQLASASRGRAHLGLAGVGTAALCCLGMIVAFHLHPAPLRAELAWFAGGEYPQQGASALAGYRGLHSYGYRPGYYPTSAQEVYGDLAKRYREYSDAIASAQASEARMRQVVQHYRDLYGSAYKRGFEQGQTYQHSVTPPTKFYVVHQAADTLGKSAEAWKAREKLLNRLHYEIVKEESKLATQRAVEKSLLQKHKLMRGTVDALLRSSAATAKQIQFLRDRYAEHIASLQRRLTRAEDERQDAHEEWLKKHQSDWEHESGLKAKVAAAIATSDYYSDKAGEAKREENTYRERAMHTAGDAAVAKVGYASALKAAIMMHEREQEALAAKNVAALKEAAIDEAMREKDASAELLAKAKSKLMEAATEAKVQTGIADAAKDAAMRASAEALDAKSKYKTAEEDLHRWQNKILAAKTGADTAAVKAKLYEEQTDAAKGELDEDIAAKDDAAEQAEEAVKAVEEAETQTALAKTQQKITESTAQQQKSDVELAVERVRREAKHVGDRVHSKVHETDELAKGHAKALEAAVRSQAVVGDANNALSLAEEKAALVEDKAKAAQEEADEKKAKAEELLKSVDEMAALAKEAAAAAAAQRQPVLGGYVASYPIGAPSAAPGSGKQTIDIHVIPHSPVMGPPGEQGMTTIDPTDEGTVRLKKAGINTR